MVTGGYTESKVLTNRVELMTFDPINNPLPSCLTISNLPEIRYAHAMTSLPPSKLSSLFELEIGLTNLVGSMPCHVSMF
jgi:hypothetical protein